MSFSPPKILQIAIPLLAMQNTSVMCHIQIVSQNRQTGLHIYKTLYLNIWCFHGISGEMLLSFFICARVKSAREVFHHYFLLGRSVLGSWTTRQSNICIFKNTELEVTTYAVLTQTRCYHCLSSFSCLLQLQRFHTRAGSTLLWSLFILPVCWGKASHSAGGKALQNIPVGSHFIGPGVSRIP